MSTFFYIQPKVSTFFAIFTFCWSRSMWTVTNYQNHPPSITLTKMKIIFSQQEYHVRLISPIKDCRYVCEVYVFQMVHSALIRIKQNKWTRSRSGKFEPCFVRVRRFSAYLTYNLAKGNLRCGRLQLDLGLN